jgi:hypothetical protein
MEQQHQPSQFCSQPFQLSGKVKEYISRFIFISLTVASMMRSCLDLP